MCKSTFRFSLFFLMLFTFFAVSETVVAQQPDVPQRKAVGRQAPDSVKRAFKKSGRASAHRHKKRGGEQLPENPRKLERKAEKAALRAEKARRRREKKAARDTLRSLPPEVRKQQGREKNKRKRASARKARLARLKKLPEIETYTSNGKRYNITGVRVGAEFGQYIFPYLNAKMLLSKYYQLHTDWQINNRFFLNLDYGFAQRARNLGFRSFYNSSGTFWRLGIDYNILGKKTEDDAIFFGFRYAFTSFGHSVIYRDRPTYWNSKGKPKFFEEDGLKAQWAELVAGFKARVFWQLYVGLTTRLQFVTRMPESTFTVVDLPGYNFAPADKGSKFNIGYYIMYRFLLWR